MREKLLVFIVFFAFKIAYCQDFDNPVVVMNDDSSNQRIYANDSIRIKIEKDLMFLLSCDMGEYENAKILLEMGANANSTSDLGVTALMYSVQSESYPIVKLLLEKYQVNPNNVSFDGNNALHIATKINNDSIAELLLRNNADVNGQNNSGITPLHYSGWYGMPYMTDLLLYYGASVDIRDNRGNTPLILSVYNGTLMSGKVLLENKANTNLVNQKGVSPLMLAAQFNDTAFIGLLYDYGADIDIVDNNGANALVYAIRANAVDAIGFLINLGAAEKSLAKSYYQIAAETDFQNLRYKLDSLGLKTKVKPSFGDVFVNTGIIFGKHEFLWGFNIGITEQVSKLNISLGYWYRPKSVATLEYIDMDIYQFREKRQVLELRVNKLKPVRTFRKNNLGIYYGGSVDLIFRNFRGTENDPNTSIYPGVNVGFYWGSQTTKVFAGWEYITLRTPDASQHRIGVSVNFYFPVSKPRYSKTYIDYVD